MDWNFTPMTAEAAQAIALWQYEPPHFQPAGQAKFFEDS
jgi:hypothetical protein